MRVRATALRSDAAGLKFTIQLPIIHRHLAESHMNQYRPREKAVSQVLKDLVYNKISYRNPYTLAGSSRHSTLVVVLGRMKDAATMMENQ